MLSFRSQLRSAALSAGMLALALSVACAEHECPDGFDKVGNSCLRHDGGAALTADDGAVLAGSMDAATVSGADGAWSLGADASAAPADAAPAPVHDGGPGSTALPASPSDANVAPGVDGRGDRASAAPPMLECDNGRPCSAGYACVSSKCVSLCEQTRCDPNATCALSGGAPVCSCNSGFIAQGSGAAMTCLADVACADLRCHTNAGCDRGPDQRRVCTCKPGYTGTGMSCAPVSCGPLTIQNGTVTGGSSYGESATYRCNTGYQFAFAVGTTTRMCGSDMRWTGSEPRCDPISCGVPPIVLSATVSPNTAGTYNSSATYTCNTGYTISGNATITCQLSGTWTSRPSCTANPVCGNGRVETGEECEPSALLSDPWKCNTQCKRTTAYNSCLANTDGLANAACSSGEVCTAGICSPSCSTSAQCPDPPAGWQKACVASVGVCLAAKCRSSGDCARGVGCVKDPGASTGACMGCRASEHCQSGVCVNVNGASSSDGPLVVAGRCQ